MFGLLLLGFPQFGITTPEAKTYTAVLCRSRLPSIPLLAQIRNAGTIGLRTACSFIHASAAGSSSRSFADPAEQSGPQADTIVPGAQEDNTTSENIRAYFDVYDGYYNFQEPIIRTATWDAWLDYGDSFADQV